MGKVTILVTSLFVGAASASVEIPIAWETIAFTAEQFGGASVVASRTEDALLRELRVTIQDRQIDIPSGCLPNGLTVFLNTINLTYGQFDGNVPYWSLEFGVDYEAGYDGTGTYYLVLLEDRVKLAHITYPESEDVLVDEPPLCGAWSAG